MGCAGKDDHVIGNATSPIIGGERDDDHPSVVLLLHYASDPKNNSSCTGTVITPHLVLTAAHCVFPEIIGPVESAIFFGNDFKDKGQRDDRQNWVRVKEMRFHPGYKGATVPGHDIGVVITRDPIPLRPMRFRTDPLTLELVKGQPMLAVGYGLTDATSPVSSGVRSRKETTVSSFLGADLMGVTNGTLCHGDSGGAILWKVNGVSTLVGIPAFVTTEACTGANCATRPDVYASDYIAPIAEEVDPGYLANVPPDDEKDAGVLDAGAGDAPIDASRPGQSASNPADTGCMVHPYSSGSSPVFVASALGVFALVARRRRRATKPF